MPFISSSSSTFPHACLDKIMLTCYIKKILQHNKRRSLLSNNENYSQRGTVTVKVGQLVLDKCFFIGRFINCNNSQNSILSRKQVHFITISLLGIQSFESIYMKMDASAIQKAESSDGLGLCIK